MTDEAMIEAVARAICTETYGRCTCAEGYADYHVYCDDAERSARSAIRVFAPLIVERCAEVAVKEATDFKSWGNLEASYGCSVVSDAIRALIQKEASDA